MYQNCGKETPSAGTSWNKQDSTKRTSGSCQSDAGVKGDVDSSDSDCEQEKHVNKKTCSPIGVQGVGESSDSLKMYQNRGKETPSAGTSWNKQDSTKRIKKSYQNDAEVDVDTDSSDSDYEQDKRVNTKTCSLIRVQGSNKSPDGRRVYDKTNTCLYCTQELKKIGRHLLSVHKDEPEVSEILAYNCGQTKDRKTKLEILLLKGNNYHNIKVLKIGGVLNVIRRPNISSDESYLGYSPCLHCFAFVMKHEIWRQNKRCVLKKQGINETHNRKLQHESQMLLYSSQDSHDDRAFIDAVLSTMKNDDVTFVIKRDSSIFRYGSQA